MQADEKTCHPLTLRQSHKLGFKMAAKGVPSIQCDDFFEAPQAARDFAIAAAFTQPGGGVYPGKVAAPDPDLPEICVIREYLLDIVNSHYLPRVPMTHQGHTIEKFEWADIDFSTVNIDPRELSEMQRRPHVDDAAIFGLVYLNPEWRGGTLFFEQVEGEPVGYADGYCIDTIPGFRLKGRISGHFNQLAIYPGFVFHTGEIAGDWIEDDRRYTEPRVTMRVIFRERR